MIDPITNTIEVACDPKTAFAIFTERMSSWWPVETNSVSAMNGDVARSVEIEPRVGGQVFEIKSDGEREDWARVKVFEPGKRLALAWHVMSPEDQATDVEISFAATENGTRIVLTHSGWEIMGETAQARRDSYDSGWVRVFEEQFASACSR